MKTGWVLTGLMTAGIWKFEAEICTVDCVLLRLVAHGNLLTPLPKLTLFINGRHTLRMTFRLPQKFISNRRDTSSYDRAISPRRVIMVVRDISIRIAEWRALSLRRDQESGHPSGQCGQGGSGTGACAKVP